MLSLGLVSAYMAAWVTFYVTIRGNFDLFLVAGNGAGLDIL